MNTLSAEQIMTIREEAVRAASKTLIGRSLIPTVDVGDGTQVYESRLSGEVVDAMLVAPGGDFTIDEESIVYAYAYMQKPGKAIAVTMEDLKSDSTIITRLGTGCGKKIGDAEDDMIFNGGTAPPISGMINGAGNTGAASQVWSTAAGTNTIYADVLASEDRLLEDNFTGAKILIVSRGQYKEMRAQNITAGASGGPYLNEVEEGILGVGNVHMSVNVADGTGILHEPGLDNMVLLEAEDLTIDGPYKKENQTEQYNVYLRSVSHIYRDESLDALTSL